MNLATLGKTALKVLDTVAPTILAAIGGPFGALAAAALHAALGTTPGDDKSVDTALTGASQDTLLKVKAAELDLQAKLAELGVQKEQLQFEDVASARNLEVQTKSSTPTILSYCVLAASMGAFLGVVCGWVKIPTDPQTALIYGSVLTYLVTESKAVLAYWFGSSQGSQNKDATIADMAKQP
jgi:hypothetical protein